MPSTSRSRWADWSKENRDKVLLANRKWAKENSDYVRWRKLRERAKRSGLEFNLTLEDLIPPKVCPVLGIPLFYGAGKLSDNSPSVDRVDPAKGYTKENVQIISYRANSIKRNATACELRKIADYIDAHLKVN